MALDQKLDQDETNRLAVLNAKPANQRTAAENAELAELNKKRTTP